MTASTRRVAVFDLDDTLVRGDSFAQFTRHLLFRQRWRAAVSLVLAPLLVPMLFLSPTRRVAITGFLWLASAGLSEAQFTALAEQFAATHAQKRIAVALDRLQRHLATGDRVIIVTACADPLAAAICAELGLGEVEVIAARLRAGRTGMWPALGCRGAQKVQRLRDAGVALPVDYAYTDSLSDLPLLRAATHRYLIEPSAQDLTRLQAAFPGAVTVLETTAEVRRLGEGGSRTPG
jgi:phosphatidylglycerophosphatase C